MHDDQTSVELQRLNPVSRVYNTCILMCLNHCKYFFIIDCISISVLRHRRVCFCLCDSELQFAATVSNLQYVVLCIIRLWTANFWSLKWTLVHCISFCIFIILYNIVISRTINSCKLSIKFWKLEYNYCPDCRSFWTKRVCPQNVFTVLARTQTQHSSGVFIEMQWTHKGTPAVALAARWIGQGKAGILGPRKHVLFCERAK